ncbi:recombinase RecT [Pararobbsia silviterrae]|uniref:Recombinase RecT n=2 Tax=Pararobbsia silviterrae TaxID=1792498 RepID=A0A494X1U9_9BURK|nr:recombinase RecT [Pararobbsia silviterrae]
MATTSLTALRENNAPTEKKSSPQQTLSDFFQKHKAQLEMALPTHLKPDRMMRLALTQFSQNAELAKCDIRTIFASVIVAAQLGLEIGITGQGYLVPYKGKCTFVPGWQGLVDLVARAGRAVVYTGVIYSDQKYTFTDGARRDLVIHNETSLDDPLDITHAYAIGWIKGADIPVVELWPISKIARHRDKVNKVGQKHYSFNNWEMYARKVPLLQVIKYVPKSVELSNAIALDAASEDGKNFTIDGDGLIAPISDLNTPDVDDGQHGAENDTQRVESAQEPAQTTTIATAAAPSHANSAQAEPEQDPAEREADKIEQQLRNATSEDTLDIAADLISSTPKHRHKALNALFRERRAALQEGAQSSKQATLIQMD